MGALTRSVARKKGAAKRMAIKPSQTKNRSVHAVNHSRDSYGVLCAADDPDSVELAAVPKAAARSRAENAPTLLGVARSSICAANFGSSIACARISFTP